MRPLTLSLLCFWLRELLSLCGKLDKRRVYPLLDEGFVLRDSPNKSLLWKYPDWCFNNSWVLSEGVIFSRTKIWAQIQTNFQFQVVLETKPLFTGKELDVHLLQLPAIYSDLNFQLFQLRMICQQLSIGKHLPLSF